LGGGKTPNPTKGGRGGGTKKRPPPLPLGPPLWVFFLTPLWRAPTVLPHMGGSKDQSSFKQIKGEPLRLFSFPGSSNSLQLRSGTLSLRNGDSSSSEDASTCRFEGEMRLAQRRSIRPLQDLSGIPQEQLRESRASSRRDGGEPACEKPRGPLLCRGTRRGQWSL